MDFDVSFFQPPASVEAIGVEALRCCSTLLIAFAYADAWPGEDRAHRRLAKRGAALVRGSFSNDRGRDAISWAAQSYGRVMAELQRRAEGRDPETVAASAAGHEWLADVAQGLWPVSDEAPIAFARESCEARPTVSADAAQHLWAAQARREATIEMLCLATWPDVETALEALSFDVTLQLDAAVLNDWVHVADFWMNLVDPDRRRPCAEVMDSHSAQIDRG